MTEKIGVKVASGIRWNALSILGTRGTDFVVKLILARMLMPESFGLVGMALIITGFLSIFSDMGLFNALVQKKEDHLSQVRYSSAFWYLLLLATSFVLCFFLFISHLGAQFYNEPDLAPVMNGLSLYLFFHILSIIPRVILTKQLNFKDLVKITYLGAAISSIVAIGMAFLNFGVWSLVAKSVMGSGIIFFSYWIKVGWRPSFVFKPAVLKDLAGYSFFTQTNALLFYLRSNLDYIIIGKLASSYLLGVYTLAFTLSETLRSQLYSIFNKVFFPIYSKLQDDIKKIKEYYLKVMRFTAVITFPVSILLISIPEKIIIVAFGEKWIDAAAPLRILAIASMIFSISGTPAEVLKSIGKVSVSFYLNITNTFFVALPLMYFGLQYFGLQGVAYAVCIQYAVSRITFHHFMKKYIGLTDKEVLVTLRRPLLSAALMLITIEMISIVNMNIYFKLLASLLLGGGIYTLLLLNDFIKIYYKLTNKKKRVVKNLSISIFKKNSFIFHFRDKTYKFFTQSGSAAKNAEIKGNKEALQYQFWKSYVMQIEPSWFYLKMKSGEPVDFQKNEEVEAFVNKKLQDSYAYEIQPASQLYSFVAIKAKLKHQIDDKLLQQAEKILDTILLPVTSAHGDFHINNIVKVCGKIKVIDWSMFSRKGSFITDYIHYYNYDSSKRKKTSWAENILNVAPYLDILAQDLNTTTNHLRLAYTISRISGEITQINKNTPVSFQKVFKYNQILKSLINEFSKTKVQCNNSLIQ